MPNLKVSWTVSSANPASGSEDDFVVTVANVGTASALQTHLRITLPATVTLLGPPYYERGSGCTGTQVLDCYLDYISNGTSTVVKFSTKVSGTLRAAGGEPRIVNVDDHTTDLPPAAHMLVVRNDDRPGMIGYVGTALGNAGVNIADMDVVAARPGRPSWCWPRASRRRPPSSSELPRCARHPVRARRSWGSKLLPHG